MLIYKNSIWVLKNKYGILEYWKKKKKKGGCCIIINNLLRIFVGVYVSWDIY